jgi:putative lipoprotein
MAIGFTLVPRRAWAQDPDPWWGRDKALHFGAGATIAATGYGVGTAIWPERWKAMALGGGSAIAIGALKEGLDATGFGDPSWKDFTWDVIGAVVGLGVAYAVDYGIRGSAPPIGRTSAALITF